jgi:hypothetical protein
MLRSQFRSGAVIAVVALGSFGSPRALAVPIPRVHVPPHLSETATLQKVKTLLEHADHDYKGHRAAAVHELTAAIHELHPHHHAAQGKRPSAARPHPKTGTGKPHEPQKLSDAQLREAIAMLEGVRGTMTRKKAGNAHKAAEHVSRAISELKTALTVK